MTDLSTLLRQGRHEEIWTKYLGFLDLNPNEFMDIQERLLKEQLDLLGKSLMGRMLMGDVIPKSIEEFREIVPLTSYKDYQVYLDQKKTDVLPREPIAWAHTSGRSGDFKYKWAPYTQKMFDLLGASVTGSMILSSCTAKGEINLSPNDTVLLATAHEPYISGLISKSADQQMDLQFLPPLEEAQEMEFIDIIQTGFKMAMVEGMDYFYGLASILVNIGQRFEQGGGSFDFSLKMLRPDVLYRLLKSFLKGKLQGGELLPKDIWTLKGIMTGGVDTSIYKKQIEYFWGRKPLEGYACTEGGSICMQAWNYNGMTFIPDVNFLEFIPHEEHKKNKKDPSYQPKTVLYNELELGIYELVFTNFHGGIFTRYRVGDLFRVVSLRDEELDINLPQVQFYSRDSDLINLAGFALITEKDIWRALERTGLNYHEWVARKVLEDNQAYLHIFVEMKDSSSLDLETITSKVDTALREINSDYNDLEEMLGYQALRVNLLNPGAFGVYMDYQKSKGADLAHTKPPHMKPTEKQMKKLLEDRKLKEPDDSAD